MTKLIKIWEQDGLLIIDYYKKRIAKNKESANDYASLDWKSQEKYKKVFQTVINLINPDEVNSIFDIGCGAGNFYKFFKTKYPRRIKYYGIDIVSSFIMQARKKYPKISLKVINFISKNFNHKQTWNLVINLGGLNSRTRYYHQYIKYSISKMLKYTNRFLIFSLITNVNQNYFPKGNNKKVGHICGLNYKFLKQILGQIKKQYSGTVLFKIKKINLFKGSQDTFVCIKKL
ncbi:MAG: methyltransferase type 12 [Parcubacteria group bacterium Athens1014_10]|nr:MAG: methyltransferase type 12 [Parcubacteria group bacterium Athens1014_10]